jgi:hypothetical protein
MEIIFIIGVDLNPPKPYAVPPGPCLTFILRGPAVAMLRAVARRGRGRPFPLG